MRFLVVYENFSKPAKELVDRLGVKDVSVLLVRKGENRASSDLLSALKKYPDAPTAVCQIVRGVRKSLEDVVDIQYATKEFRANDQQLAHWLLPADTQRTPLLAPSQAVAAAEQRAEHLVVAFGALQHADEIASHRWRFTNTSAELLRRYAEGEDLGANRNWKQAHGVDFATNGRVRYEYEISSNGAKVKRSTEWHLKEGDHTSREGAARIYFDHVQVGVNWKVCILYVGPHPADGDYSVRIDCDRE